MENYQQPKPLVYSYIRFSTSEQAKGHSLKRQMKYAKEVAERKGLEIDSSLTLQDLGVSSFRGQNATKGVFGGFLRKINEGEVPDGSILIIESLDRLSRATMTECNSIITQIINAGITVITAMDNKEYNKELIDGNPFELLGMLLIFMRANEESQTKSKRARSTIIKECESWLEGKRGFKISCGKPPKWLKWDDEAKVFKFKSREKAIMLKKLELYKAGYGALKIAELVNEEFGEDTMHYSGANIYKEIKRRNLIGELSVSSDDYHYTLESYYPSLMSLAEFEQLQIDSKGRGGLKHKAKFIGILSGVEVFKCGTCGYAVNSHVNWRGRELEDVPSSHKRYGCAEAKRSDLCGMNKTVPLEHAENAIVRFCQDNVNLRSILQQDDVSASIAKQESTLLQRLKESESEISNLVQFIAQGNSAPKSILAKLNSLEKEQESINDQLQSLNNKKVKIRNTMRDEVSDRWLGLTKNLRTLGPEQRMPIRQLVKDTFKKITLQVGIKQEHTGGLSSFIDAFGGNNSKYFDLTCEFHNGQKRLLRIHLKTGELVQGMDLNSV
ncbi:recombinase family protein [Pseudoalteromonas 'SMAR']|uniref:recombinase family protein n=1 Tax=Pseudoalteromonas 'SMAR' TaxID=3416908 RepID=UPI003AF2531E